MTVSAAVLAASQVRLQDAPDRLVGPQEMIIDPQPTGFLAQPLAEAVEVGPVLRPHPRRMNQYPSRRLQGSEQRRAAVGELDLLRRQDVEQNDLVPTAVQSAQRLEERRQFVEEVGEDH